MYMGKGISMVGLKFFNNIRKGVFCVFVVIIDGYFYDVVVQLFVDF